ncbi:hypothetical protein [Sphingomonas sp. CARO-RG-8B-R24-01]|uniref:hypothetical protein n=1 Tax=Sphingomonas sp. CARO-RG-8B-R24-01 TaxID=2914831 RepID=UPI001F57D792|nr:hypothetical protein [Sphingomonas sp. CARO-RG-8B-R24-01]
MNRTPLAVLLLLAACQQGAPPPTRTTATPIGLEAAAIQAGIIPDPASTDITGLYAREGDRVCIVPSATAYRIGVAADYDDREHCSGTGTVTRAGEILHVTFEGEGGGQACAFDARFEGDRLVFPGRLPSACQRICTDHASVSGLMLDRLSESLSEASTLRDLRGKLLCPSDGRS